MVAKRWRMVEEHQTILSITPPTVDCDGKLLEIRKTIHRTIQEVSDSIESFAFNKAVAKTRELTNLLSGLDVSEAKQGSDIAAIYSEGMVAVVHLIAPMLPHIAEEMWAHMGGTDMVCTRQWPDFDASLLVDNTVTVAVQVNGKLRATLELVKDIDKSEAEKLALDEQTVINAIGGKPIKKVIVVPNRIINVVV